MAWARRVLAAVSGSAPPSMSKSTLVSLYASTTLPYAAASSSAEEHVSRQLGAGGAAEGDPDVAALGRAARRSARPPCRRRARVTPPHFGVAAAAGGDEGEVELLHAGLLGGVEQVVGGVEGGVDVGGEAGAAVVPVPARDGRGGRRGGGRLVGVGVGVGWVSRSGVGDPVGRPLGSGVAPSSAEQLASSMRQPVGSAGAVDDEADGDGLAWREAVGVPLGRLHGDVLSAHAGLGVPERAEPRAGRAGRTPASSPSPSGRCCS